MTLCDDFDGGEEALSTLIAAAGKCARAVRRQAFDVSGGSHRRRL